MLLRVKRMSVTKNQSHRIASLVTDAIKAFNARAFSSIFQVLTYLSITLYIFTLLAQYNFLWIQVLSSFIAGFAMCLALFVMAGVVPRFIPSVLETAKGYLKELLSRQFDIVALSSFIVISVVMLSLLAVYLFISDLAVIGFGLGIVFSSFFIRIGSALFISSIDIGKSVSKERDPELPSDDERNLGTILEISGDYIARLCGFCSDILGSFVLSFIALILFAKSFKNQYLFESQLISFFENLPFQILAVSIGAALVSYVYAKIRIKRSAHLNVLLESLYVSMLICGLGTFMFTRDLPANLQESIWTGSNGFNPFIAYIIGLVGATLMSFTAEVLSSNKYPFSKNLARFSEYGSAILYLKGAAVGLKSNLLYLIYILLITVLANSFAGFYGIAMSSLGILSVTPTIIIISAFGPLASSTYKVATLSTSSKTVLDHNKHMQSLGHSTIAIGNGFSSGTTVLATLSLFLSAIYLSNSSLSELFTINIYWLIALVTGVLLPFIISGFLLSQLSSISIFILSEIKRQFSEIPYLLQGKATPDVIKASDVTARRSMDALIIPGLLIALIPIVLAYLFNIEALVALSLGILISGMALNFYWSITGDIVHNASHYVQSGHCGGPNSENDKAMRHCDNSTNAYRALLSPSVNILIKSTMILTMVIILFLK